MVTLCVVPAPGSGAPTYSQLNPPPLCDVDDSSYCVWQPDAFLRNSPTPILITMPTMTKDVSSPGGDEPTGNVSFSIYQHASPPAGHAARSPRWVSTVYAVPMGDFAAPEAEQFQLGRRGNCSGTPVCVYDAYETDLAPGWYYASGFNGGLASQKMCPMPNPNGVYGCYSVQSESAFYVPDVRDVPPPTVMADVSTAGLTVKAVATVRDPAGMPLTLTWDFGDGDTAPGVAGQVVTHTYDDYGDYSVTARVEASDGRIGTDSHEAGLSPPAPKLQSVARSGATTTGTATALLQAWPSSAYVLLRYWTTGCPADPAADAPSAPFAHSSWTAAQGDGSVSVPLTNLPLNANAFVLQARSDVITSGQVRSTEAVSNCVTTLGALAETTGATPAGEDEVPVDSGSVPIGNIAVIDAGTPDAEQRLVTGHGSLILGTPLAKAHPAGAKVVDAGPPVAPYVAPPPPSNPTPPTLPPDNTGYTPTPGTGGAKKPGAPTITKTKAKPGKKVVVKLRAGPANGSPITSYSASCKPKGGGPTRTATAAKLTLKVTKLTAGKKYRCTALATNGVGASPWSKKGKAVTALP